MSTYMQSAFHQVCTQAAEPAAWFVCLIEETQRYGGPEEGGWWYSSQYVVAYQEFARKEDAERAAERVQTLAEEFQAEALAEHGRHCLESLEWLEARGLEPDFFPEPDGPDTYRVEVLTEIPVFDNRKPVYC